MIPNLFPQLNSFRLVSPAPETDAIDDDFLKLMQSPDTKPADHNTDLAATYAALAAMPLAPVVSPDIPQDLQKLAHTTDSEAMTLRPAQGSGAAIDTAAIRGNAVTMAQPQPVPSLESPEPASMRVEPLSSGVPAAAPDTKLLHSSATVELMTAPNLTSDLPFAGKTTDAPSADAGVTQPLRDAIPRLEAADTAQPQARSATTVIEPEVFAQDVRSGLSRPSPQPSAHQIADAGSLRPAETTSADVHTNRNPMDSASLLNPTQTSPRVRYWQTPRTDSPNPTRVLLQETSATSNAGSKLLNTPAPDVSAQPFKAAALPEIVSNSPVLPKGALDPTPEPSQEIKVTDPQAQMSNGLTPNSTSTLALIPADPTTLALSLSNANVGLAPTATMGTDGKTPRGRLFSSDRKPEALNSPPAHISMPVASLAEPKFATTPATPTTHTSPQVEKPSSEIATDTAIDTNAIDQKDIPTQVDVSLRNLATAPTAHRLAATAPGNLHAQLMQHAAAAMDRQVELHLAPEDLGRLKFQIQHRGESVVVFLTAERPETMEMLRRNADELMREFRQSGFTGTTLDFGQWGQQRPSQQQTPPAFALSETEFSLSPPIPRPATAASSEGAAQGLNLRL